MVIQYERPTQPVSPSLLSLQPTASTQVGPLPAGWEEIESNTGGRSYYATVDGELTQWNRPTQPYIPPK